MRSPLLPVVLLSAALATAQSIESGPPKGRALTAIGIVGPAGAAADAAAGMQRGPAAILFVHEITRNVAPMLRAYADQCGDLTAFGLRSAMVLLAADRTAAEGRAPMVARSLGLQQPLLLSTDGAEGPGNYALHRKASLTLVLAVDGKVAESMAFTDTNAADADLLAMGLYSIAGEVPDDAAALRQALAARLPQDRDALLDVIARLEAQRRRLLERVQELGQARAGGRQGMQPQRQGRAEPGRSEPMAASAPAHPPAAVPDEQLAASVRTLVRQDLDAQGIDAAFAAIDQRLQQVPELRPALQRSLRDLLQQPGYGNAAARARMQRWLQDGGR